MTKTLNRLRNEAYQNAKQHGFHDSDNEVIKTMAGLHALIAQRIALIHSELSEALEADRKERYANMPTCMLLIARDSKHQKKELIHLSTGSKFT